MGNAVVLYGYILTENKDAEHNIIAIAALPSEDTWPILTRDMFAIPLMEHGYNEMLITFGLVYKNLFPDGEDWIRWRTKFETLLSLMSWYEAQVHLDIESIGRYRFRWEQDPQQHYLASLPKTPHTPDELWTFSGGKLDENRV